MQWTLNKKNQKHDARAQLLLCSNKPTVFWRSPCSCRLGWLRSIIRYRDRHKHHRQTISNTVKKKTAYIGGFACVFYCLHFLHCKRSTFKHTIILRYIENWLTYFLCFPFSTETRESDAPIRVKQNRHFPALGFKLVTTRLLSAQPGAESMLFIRGVPLKNLEVIVEAFLVFFQVELFQR